MSAAPASAARALPEQVSWRAAADGPAAIGKAADGMVAAGMVAAGTAADGGPMPLSGSGSAWRHGRITAATATMTTTIRMSTKPTSIPVMSTGAMSSQAMATTVSRTAPAASARTIRRPQPLPEMAAAVIGARVVWACVLFRGGGYYARRTRNPDASTEFVLDSGFVLSAHPGMTRLLAVLMDYPKRLV